ERLRTSQGDLARAQGVASIGSWSWDVTTGRVTWSDETYRIHGLEPGEVAPSLELARSFIHPDDTQPWEAAVLQAVESQNHFTFEYRALRADGKVTWIHNEADITRDESGKALGIFGTAQDVTARKLAEEKLRASKEKFRSVFDNIAIGVVVISTNMEILELNRQMKEWFPDIDPSDRPICYQAFNDPPLNDICSYCPMVETLRDGQVHEGLTATPRKSGARNYRVVASPIKDEHGKVMAAIEMVEDLTELLQAQEELRRSESSLRSTLDGLAANIALLDERGDITLVNKSWRQFAEDNGISAEAVSVGTNYLRVCDEATGEHAEGAREFAEGIRAVLDSREPACTMEYPCHSPDERRWFVGTVTPLSGEGQRGVVIAHHVITSHKLAEGKLRLEDERLRSLLRLSQSVELTERDLIEKATEEIVRLTGSHIGYLHLIAEDERTIESYTWSRGASEHCGIGNTPHLEVDRGGVWAECVRLRRPVIHNNYAPRPDRNGCSPRHVPVFRHANAPIFDDGRLVAIVGVGNKTDPYDESDTREMSLFGNTVWSLLKRQRAENTLREQRQFLQMLIDEIPSGVFWKSIDGLYRGCNKTLADWLGRQSDELIGHGVHDLFGKDIADVYDAADRALLEGQKRQVYESRVRHIGGSERAVLFQKATYVDQDGALAGIVGVVTDITDRKQAEDAIRDSEAALVLAQAIAKVGSWRYDVACDKLTWSAETFRIFGRDPAAGEPTALEHREIIHPHDWDGLDRAVQEAIKGGQPVREQFRILHPGGNVLWVELIGEVNRGESGEVIELHGTVQDVTERNQALEALGKAKNMLQEYLDVVGVITVALDTDGRITLLNRAGCAMLGVVEADVLGELWLDRFVPDEDRQRTKECLAELVAGRTESFEYFENAVVTARGEERLIAWHNAIARDDAGRVIGSLGSGEDITDRRRAEVELARYREHLEELVRARTAELEDVHQKLLQQERLGVLGQLTATVSHELRTPLGTLQATLYTIAELVRGRGLGVEEAMERAERNIIRCDEIIEELLDFARVTKLELTNTNIDEWLTQAVREQAVPLNVTVELSLGAGVKLPLDRDKMLRCIINLVSNASHAAVAQPEGRIVVTTAVRDDWLAIEVSDNGPGMPEKELKRVFEPLFSTKGFGVGLGLPNVKRLIEAHGGRVEMASTVGHGTTATIWLPLAAE
ncbi:MAG: PAS domain S-box protein, partial [Phycisphaerae bacterium]|nr:PAS domain S-box protein [Phycisphaerae bacterium]